MVTPLGVDVNWTLWMFDVSLFIHSMVVPGATVTLAGLKLKEGIEPTPAGR
jgi:hypothetical protein